MATTRKSESVTIPSSSPSSTTARLPTPSDRSRSPASRTLTLGSTVMTGADMISFTGRLSGIPAAPGAYGAVAARMSL